jgi:hypothetical protein
MYYSLIYLSSIRLNPKPLEPSPKLLEIPAQATQHRAISPPLLWRHIWQLSPWQTDPLGAAADGLPGIGTTSLAAEEEVDTETIATSDGTTTIEAMTVTTDGATDPGPEKGTGTGTEMEGDPEGTGTAGVTAPGRATTENLATVARHTTRTTRTTPGAGETLTARAQEAGATERPDTEMVRRGSCS